MMGRFAMVVAGLAFAGAARADEPRILAHQQMDIGQRFEIRTRDRLYQGQLVDRLTGETLLATSRDGHEFGPPQKVFLLGATPGRQAGYLRC